jgi:hypothetical protein
MAYQFGKLRERLTGSLFHFIKDGTDISEDETPSLVSNLVKPAAAVFTDDYTMGRINSSKYVPKTKERTREWSKETGGYKTRTTKQVLEDAFEITVIDYATALFDQLAFGLAGAPVDNAAQQAFSAADRWVDGWAQLTIIEEDGTKSGILTIHVRLEIATAPEMKNEDGSPVWRIAHLDDGGALDLYLPYPVAA